MKAKKGQPMHPDSIKEFETILVDSIAADHDYARMREHLGIDSGRYEPTMTNHLLDLLTTEGVIPLRLNAADKAKVLLDARRAADLRIAQRKDEEHDEQMERDRADREVANLRVLR